MLHMQQIAVAVNLTANFANRLPVSVQFHTVLCCMVMQVIMQSSQNFRSSYSSQTCSCGVFSILL